MRRLPRVLFAGSLCLRCRLADLGEEQEFRKGDARPEKNVRREIHFRSDREDAARRYLAERAMMIQMNIHPMIPDKLGCWLCESRFWCPRFDLQEPML